MRVEVLYRIVGPDGLIESFAVAAPLEVGFVFVLPRKCDESPRRWWGGVRPRKPALAIAVGEDRSCVFRAREGEISRRKKGFDASLVIEPGHALRNLKPGQGKPAGLDDLRLTGVARGEERDSPKQAVLPMAGREQQA